MKHITIAGVESKSSMIILLENTGETYKGGEPKQNKYKIWLKDVKTGQPSLAYTQYQKLRPIAGDTLPVDVYEKDAKFINPQGKEVAYIDRTINKFILDGEGNPSIAPQSSVSTPRQETAQSTTSGEINARIDKMSAYCKGMNIEIENLKKKVLDLENANLDLMAKVNELESNEIPVIKPKLSESEEAMARAIDIKF